MMYVKTPSGGGAMELHEAERDVVFLGQHCVIAVTSAESGAVAAGSYPFDGLDDRFPRAEHVVVNRVGYPFEDGSHYVRWVTWRTRGERYMLVTDGPVWLLNDCGDTIENLRSPAPDRNPDNTIVVKGQEPVGV